MQKHVTALMLSSVTVGGCGSTLAQQSFECPEKGGAPWTEVSSTHFTLKTDLDPKTAQEVSANLEARFSSLADLGFASPIEVRTRIDVVYFRHRDEYEKVAPRLSAGMFRTDVRDFERTPLAVLQGDFTQSNKETLQHELTHHFVHALYPQAPVWLNEGLAVYFSTLDVEGDTAILGRAPHRFRFWKGDWHAQIEEGEISVAIPMSEAPSAASLLSMSVTEFEGAADRDPRTSEGQNALKRMGANYAGAWNLVHLCMTGPTVRPLFDDYEQRLLHGEPNERAWAESVGRIPPEKLQKDYTGSLVSVETITQRTNYAPPANKQAVRPMPDADVHVLWARLRNWKSPEGNAAAKNDLSEATRQVPHHPGAAMLSAYWDYVAEDHSAAERTLKDALTARPDDPRLLNALGWVELHANSKTTTAAALVPVAEKLAPLAKTAAEFDLLARNSALHDDIDGALAYEKRAIAADASCYQCFSQAAGLLAEKGALREALQAATLALGLVPEGADPERVADQVDTYRRRLTEGRPAAEPPKR